MNDPIPLRPRHAVEPFRREGLGYVLDVPAMNCRIRLTHMKNKDDQLAGRLTVETMQGDPQSITFANLLSKIGKGTLVTDLTTYQGRGGREVDPTLAKVVVESFTLSVLKSHERRNTVTLLSEATPMMEPPYLIDGLVYEACRNTLFAAGGAGKGYLAALMAVMVQYGVGAAGLPAPRQGNVMYIDAEDKSGILRGRCDALARPLGLPDAGRIRHQAQVAALKDDAEYLSMVVAQNRIEFIIADSVDRLIGGGGSYSTYEDRTTQLYDACNAIAPNATWLMIDHISGESKLSSGIPKMIGSVHKGDWVRLAWFVKHRQMPGEKVNHVELHQYKRNYGAAKPPIGFTFDFSRADGVHVTQEGAAQMPTAEEASQTHGARCRLALEGLGEGTYAAIARVTGLDKALVAAAMWRMAKQHEVYNSGTVNNEKLWKLGGVSDGPEELSF